MTTNEELMIALHTRHLMRQVDSPANKSGRSVPRSSAGKVDDVGVSVLDQAVQMRVNKAEAWRRSPVSQQPRLDVFRAQRFAQLLARGQLPDANIYLEGTYSEIYPRISPDTGRAASAGRGRSGTFRFASKRWALPPDTAVGFMNNFFLMDRYAWRGRHVP
jgi:hypothetical protein